MTTQQPTAAQPKRYSKPLPQPDSESEGYWKALKEHKLMVPHCKACGHYFFWMRAFCPKCHSDQTELVQSKGRGKVHTFTTIRQNMGPGFRDEVPYTVAVVELDEGAAQMLTNIVECPVDKVKIGMAVQVVFDDVTPEVTLPKFKPA